MSVRKCPICSRPAQGDHLPFCSRRCADLDLQRWLSGRYAIPATDDESRDDDDSPRFADDD